MQSGVPLVMIGVNVFIYTTVGGELLLPTEGISFLLEWPYVPEETTIVSNTGLGV